MILLPKPRKAVVCEGALDVSAGVSVTGTRLSEASLGFALGGWLKSGGIAAEVSVADELSREGYSLVIGKNGITLSCGGAAGEFYGLLTLRQVLEQHRNGNIPCMKIDDEPDLRIRGLMLDISRNKIPTLKTLCKIVDVIAALKVNHFQLYIEGKSFRYPSLGKYYAEDADVLSAQDAAFLEAYCKDRFVEFVPNQNCFGHMSEWLAEKDFNALAECPDGFSFYGVHTPASTLDPGDEGSFRLVKRQLDDLLPLFSSGLVNIGGDEPFELGEGKSREACGRVGKGGVYLSFMKKIFACVKEHGKSPMMWGDVFKEYYKQYRTSFPQDVTILEWGYNADSFTDEVCSLYESAGFRYLLCPGTSLWNTVTGKTEIMRENVKSAARLGKKHSAEGVLLVDWGDGGTCQPFVCTLLPYATGAAYAWN
ncbi:MAG: beta-N-acetylhexosaminidase, partial [Clostridia bacterium]|nr:beta-N-acetylhexosaminidase [Clostridia bacterium]